MMMCFLDTPRETEMAMLKTVMTLGLAIGCSTSRFSKIETRINLAWIAASVGAGWSIGKRFIAVLLTCVAPSLACAQLMLPGATNGVASKPASRGSAEPNPSAPAKPIAVKAPDEEAVLGHVLSFDGARGEMRFERTGKDIALAKLRLPGNRLSMPASACDVDIVSAQPIVATDIGHPAGAQRWTVAVEACPFTVDLLDGAVLVTSAKPACDFVAADCRVNPVGLWGPAANTISPQRIKDLEKERVRAETTMRANFRVLLHRAGKDRGAIKAIASEQAAFSSEREVTCRDYKGEAVHGFCSTQITQARSLALLSKFSEQGGESAPLKVSAKRTSRPRIAKPRESVPSE